VQKVYKSQGVEIHDKHIELIVRQMLKKVRVESAGDTALLPGQLVDRVVLERENVRVKKEKKELATFQPIILGITKASLATESFLPAASVQAPKKVVAEQRRSDGDGFDVVARAPRVTLSPSAEPLELVDEPQESAPASMDFVASLDDLKDLNDAPLEPQPEFIPEGGMSTQSLMREFEMLDAELQTEAIKVAAAPPAVPEPETVPVAAMPTEALISEVDSLSAPVPPEVIEAPAAVEVIAPAPVKVIEAPASEPVERETPAWLIPPTTAVAPPSPPPPTDFNASLDDLEVPPSSEPPLVTDGEE